MSEKTSIDFLLETLEDRERFIVENYFGIGSAPKRLSCFKDIASMIKLSGNRTRCIFNKAMRKFRQKKNQHHARAVTNPELFFEIFGETKECLHMKIYFESHFNAFEKSQTFLFEDMRNHLNDTKQSIGDFEEMLKNSFTNLHNVLKGSEFNKFIQEINLAAQSVGIQMDKVRAASSNVRDASNTQIQLYNEIKPLINSNNNTPVFDQIFTTLNKINESLSDFHMQYDHVVSCIQKGFEEFNKKKF